MTPPGDHPPRRRLTQPPLVTDDPGDREPTNDDLQPLGTMGRINWVAVARTVAKVSKIILPTIVAAATAIGGGVAAYRSAARRTQESDQLSRDGYQPMRHKVDEHDRRLYDLEKRLDVASKPVPSAPSSHRGGARRRAPVVAAAPVIPPAAAPPSPPKALPSTLDKAAEAIRGVAAPPPARAPDAGQ